MKLEELATGDEPTKIRENRLTYSDTSFFIDLAVLLIDYGFRNRGGDSRNETYKFDSADGDYSVHVDNKARTMRFTYNKPNGKENTHPLLDAVSKLKGVSRVN